MFISSLPSIVIVGVTIAAVGIKISFMIFKRKKQSSQYESDLANSNVCSELPNPHWVKIGHVKELNIYPINSGAVLSNNSFKFTQHGIQMEDQGVIIWDGMFLVLDALTRKFQTCKNYKNLSNVSVRVMDNNRVKFTAPRTPSFILNINQKNINTKFLSGLNWRNGLSAPDCVDCGDAVSTWLNRFLRTTNLRLVRMNNKSTLDATNVIHEHWSRYVSAYSSINYYQAETFANLARYVLVSDVTLDRIREEKETKNVSSLRPNIVVSTMGIPYTERYWQWIKIGKVILRQIRPIPRYLPTYLKDSLSCKFTFTQVPPHFGVYYGLYVAGDVKVNDEIYVHFHKNDENIEKILKK